MKHLSRIEQIPEGSYYIALEESTYQSPPYDAGDSPTTERYLQIICFESEEEMKKWVADKQTPRYGIPTAYKIMYVRVPKITTRVDVGVTL